MRFDIEENFLDDKSAGFQLESSEIRSADALARLCLILATAILFLRLSIYVLGRDLLRGTMKALEKRRNNKLPKGILISKPCSAM